MCNNIQMAKSSRRTKIATEAAAIKKCAKPKEYASASTKVALT